ncbi:hypothetical protein ACHAXR_010458 [Thalassiosira sp. AJA248-18]
MGPRNQTTSPVFVLRGSPAAAASKRKRKNPWNWILMLIASTAILSCVILTWYQTASLASLQHNARLTEGPPLRPPEPLRFISVVGLYHSGTTAMWNSIRNNEGVAADKGIDVKAYGMSDSGGYPPCGVPLLSDSSVDMDIAMGNSSGIDESNTHLFGHYGTMWGDWSEQGPQTLKGVLNMEPPHRQDVFYTWWKHTPPQHPILACFRPDTLYVVMVRHPKVWKQSMEQKLYDIKYEPLLKLWRLIRSNPRRLPPLEMRFRALYNAWEYYTKGYLSWESMSVGKSCYVQSGSGGNINCLGGNNKIKDKRNILIVRYEDYLMNPKNVLSQVFSFATRGLINAKKDKDKFVPYRLEDLEVMKDLLLNMKDQNFFSVKDSDWDGATEVSKLCPLLGYSCDESPALFIDQ